VLIVEGLVVRDTRLARMDLGAAEVLCGDVLARRRLHERRPPEEDRAGSSDDDRLIAHRRDVRAAGRATAHDQRDLRDRGGRHPCLVVEDPAEVVPVREDIGLQRQVRPARIDEIDARQPVFERDLLRADVLLDGHRVVGAALDRRIVRDDDARRALDPPNAGDDARARCIAVVHPGRRQGTQFEECRARVDEAVDALADRELAAFPVSLDRALVARGAAPGHRELPLPQLVHQSDHRGVIRTRLGGAWIEPAAQDGHGAMIGRAGI